MKKTKLTWLLIPLALIIGVALGGLFWGGESEDTHAHDTSLVSGEATWTCSMHPQIRQETPGQCPICGMDLIPVDDFSDVENDHSIVLSPGALRLANVATSLVGTTGSPEQTLTLNGRVVPDENQRRSQSTHVAGRIERLYVNTLGEVVRRGQRIATLYSPKLIAAQQELLQAADMKSTQPQLLQAAIEKLKSFRLSDNQINEILESGKIRDTMDIYAEYGGTVLEKKVNVGDHVEQGSVLYVVSDLSRVWVEFDAYESDLPLLEAGDVIQFRVSGIPGETFKGNISFIDPVVDPKTRVASVRVEVANPNGLLKPQMFATGTVESGMTDESTELSVPRSSVLWTGKRSVVYIKTSESESGAATFRMQEVVLGPAIGDHYVVQEGLTRGDEIVTHGTFTVDAAAQLAGKPSMMNASSDRQLTSDLGVAPQPLKEALVPLIQSYLDLKNALVNSNYADAQENARSMQNTLGSIQVNTLEENWQNWWKVQKGNLSGILENTLASDNIDKIRKEFILLSGHMVEIGITADPLAETLFIMQCPMANNNEGATWLSSENEVRNPYYGEMMLTCGSVINTIN